MPTSRIVKRPDGGTEVHCADCDVTLTWFNFHNVWEGGQIAYRICMSCHQKAELKLLLEKAESNARY